MLKMKVIFLAIIANCSSDLINEDTQQFAFPSIKQNVVDKLTAKIYPNPTKNILYIEVYKPENGFQLELYDLMGRQLSTKQILNNQAAISVNHLSSGIYFLKIDKSVIKKFIVANK